MHSKAYEILPSKDNKAAKHLLTSYKRKLRLARSNESS